MNPERISSKKLDDFYKKEIKQKGKSQVNQIVDQKRKSISTDPINKTVFLCHSHLDRTLVQKIALLFSKLDINIYVDWMDETMPKVTNADTASIIHNKIKNCNRFIFLASYHGLRSKWCDWELGVAYSLKKIDHLAIFPIESKSGNWQGSEYLQLYPSIIILNDLDFMESEDIKIKRNSQSIEISLENWLN
jgi:hypothetical protein